MAKVFTTDNFETEVLNAEKPVLVDFWAVWCGPCQMMAPILHELETEMPDVQIGKVNVDEQMDLARQFRVVSIPTLIIFKNGQEVQRMVGVTSKEELKDAVLHPERHQDLIVRVGGYSDYFVRLSPALQQEIILRSESVV